MNVSEIPIRTSTTFVRRVMEYIERIDVFNLRMCLRAESTLPAEIACENGVTVKAATRDVSVAGIGFTHHEPVPLGVAEVIVFSQDREFYYRMEIAWCRAMESGKFMSGGRFLKDLDVGEESSV